MTGKTPLCAGTVQKIDAYLDGVAALLGEELPNRRFLRIEWRDIGDGDGMTTDRVVRDDVLVTNDPFDPHELVHAAHLQVWPRSHRLLMEGLATMVGTRTLLRAGPWPDGKTIDSVLGDWNGDYAAALFIVSQIVKEHGVDGLRRLWHELSLDSEAAEFRAAYQSVFARSVDELLEPEMLGPVPNTRFACFSEICLEAAEQTRSDGTWSAEGPESCAGARAVGPRSLGGGRSVWTHQVVTVNAESPVITATGGSGAVVRACGLGCNTVVHDAQIAPGVSVDLALPSQDYLVEIGHRLEDLPTDSPAHVDFEPPG